MSAREKITGLVNAWYGYLFVQAVVNLVANGIGFFSIVLSAMGLAFGFFINFLIGKWLLSKSSFARLLFVFLSALGILFGILGVGAGAWAFIKSWDLTLIVQIALACAATYMSARSYNTLTDEHVKSYFKS